MTELAGGSAPHHWDGRSFAPALREGSEAGREFLVVSQCAWSCQRGVRKGPWMYLRTYHDGMKELPPEMLFKIEEDPHETRDLVAERPEVAGDLARTLDRWTAGMVAGNPDRHDPLWTVIREGGPEHTRKLDVDRYCERLESTDRARHVEAVRARYR